MNVSIHIEGMEELKKLVAKVPGVTARELTVAVGKSVATIESHAKREAPVNKSYGGGNLRQMIKSYMLGRFSGAIESNAKYSVFVHEGTRPHVILPKAKRALANRRTDEMFGKRVNHPGTRANPYMTRAIEKSKDAINGFFHKAILNITKIL